jgi:hypothetical protein
MTTCLKTFLLCRVSVHEQMYNISPELLSSLCFRTHVQVVNCRWVYVFEHQTSRELLLSFCFGTNVLYKSWIVVEFLFSNTRTSRELLSSFCFRTHVRVVNCCWVSCFRTHVRVVNCCWVSVFICNTKWICTRRELSPNPPQMYLKKGRKDDTTRDKSFFLSQIY